MAFTWALVPRSHSPGLSYLGIRMVVDSVDLVRSRLALRTIRDRTANPGFPLDRNMAMLATSQRLVIWRASRQGLRAPKLLGERDRPHGAFVEVRVVAEAECRVPELLRVSAASGCGHADGAAGNAPPLCSLVDPLPVTRAGDGVL